MEEGRLRTSDGTEINITQDMFEDFCVISGIYNITIEELIENVFDGDVKFNASI